MAMDHTLGLFQRKNQMKNIRLKKFDYFIWAVLLIVGSLSYITGSYKLLLIAFPFLLLYVAVWTLRLLLFFLGQTKQISLSELPGTKADTSGWIKCRGILSKILPGHEVVENGRVVARLMDFEVKLEKYDGEAFIHNTYVRDVVMPVSHLGSFGINTQVCVLVNPKHRLTEAVFVPDQVAWHFEAR